MTPTIASHISEVESVTASTTAAGPSLPFGAVYTIPATQVDRALLVVDTNGVLLGGPQRELGATDELVEQEAGDGPLDVCYIRNDGAIIQRGLAVMRDASAGVFSGVVATADVPAAKCLGVTLFDLAANSAAFVAKKGVVIGVSGAAFSQDDSLKVNAAGKFITASAGDDVVGMALAAAAGADEEIRILLDV